MINEYEKDYGDEDDLYELSYKKESQRKNNILNTDYNTIQTPMFTEPEEIRKTPNINIRDVKPSNLKAYFDEERYLDLKDTENNLPLIKMPSNASNSDKRDKNKNNVNNVSNNIYQRSQSALNSNNKNNLIQNSPYKNKNSKANAILKSLNEKQVRITI